LALCADAGTASVNEKLPASSIAAAMREVRIGCPLSYVQTLSRRCAHQVVLSMHMSRTSHASGTSGTPSLHHWDHWTAGSTR